MTLPLLLATSPIVLASNSPHEYPLCYFVSDLQRLFVTEAPFAKEFHPYLEGGIDIIALFAEQLDAEFKEKVERLRTDFAGFRKDPDLLDQLIKDCREIKEFPHLRFAERICAFEKAVDLLTERASIDFEKIDYSDRLYLYGVVRALGEVHTVLCDYICCVYGNDEWEEYFMFEDIEQLCHDFLLNPTLFTQFRLQIGLAVLAEKVRNL